MHRRAEVESVETTAYYPRRGPGKAVHVITLGRTKSGVWGYMHNFTRGRFKGQCSDRDSALWFGRCDLGRHL